MPFIHINQKQDNKIGTCWRAFPVGDLGEESFEEIWNNKNIRRVRKQLLNNKRPQECTNCWKLEDSGASSYREQTTLNKLSKEREFTEFLSELNEKDCTMPFKIPYMEIRFSNLCNLQCRMCSPRFCTNWEMEWATNNKLKEFLKVHSPSTYKAYNLVAKTDKKDSKTKEKLFSFLRKDASHLKFIMIGGGEPVLHNDHYEALEVLRPYWQNIILEYTSNLTNLKSGKYNVLDYWPKFKSIDLKVSLDGDPLIYSYIRRNSLPDKPAQNIKTIQEKIKSDKLRLFLTCTTSVYNIERLPEAMNWFTELGGYAHTSLVIYPEFLSVQVLPPQLKSKINKKLDNFLSDLDKNINWDSHDRWKEMGNKQHQKDSINKFVKSCKNYMRGEDKNGWEVFNKFNDIFENKKNSILEIYPHWKKYI